MTDTQLPKNHEIRAVWRQDPPDGQVWQCQKCEYATTFGCNAAYHAMQTDHGLPKLATHPPKLPPPHLPTVRMGDAMQLMGDVDLAMEIAGVALELAKESGAAPWRLEPLTRLYMRLKAVVDGRRDPATTRRGM